MVFVIELALNAFFFVVFGAILLFARRNMKGWNQPIKEVWFSFGGRLNRKAYWLKGVLLVSMISIAVQVFAGLIGLTLGTGLGALIGGTTLLVIFLPFMVFNIWVGLAIAIKRFHDLGSSGWWVLGVFIPFYNIWLGIKLLFFRGTVGPNAYGPDPIDPYYDAVDELFGADGGDDGETDADVPPRPQPRPPQDGGSAPQGFGSKAFTKPVEPQTREQEPEDDFTPVDMSGGSANLEVIKRRLGEDILRPIKRKGGGGRDAEG